MRVCVVFLNSKEPEQGFTCSFDRIRFKTMPEDQKNPSHAIYFITKTRQ